MKKLAMLVLLACILFAFAGSANAQAKTQCNDKRDNDGDGKIDYPADPGCTSRSDNNETDPIPTPPAACADGVDNDGDGLTDYPADPGCASTSDTDEADPVPPSGSVVWKASADSPIESEWAELSTQTHCAVTTFPGISDSRFFEQSAVVAKGTGAYQSHLVDGDNCYNERAEAGQGNPTRSDMLNRLFNQGEERWVSFQVLLGSNYDTLPYWSEIAQFKQLGGLGSPIFDLNTSNNQWHMERTTSDPNNQYPSGFQKDFVLGPTAKGTWTKFTYHIKFSPDASVGFVEIFADLGDGLGMRRVLPFTQMSTMKVDNGSVVQSHARIGQYRNATIAGNSDVYYDGYTVATDRASAEANAF